MLAHGRHSNDLYDATVTSASHDADGSDVRFSFGTIRQCRELVAAVRSVATVRGEIAQLERRLLAPPPAPFGGEDDPTARGAQDPVVHVRLEAKWIELQATITQAEALAGAIASGTPAPPSTTAEKPSGGFERRSTAIRGIASGYFGSGMVASAMISLAIVAAFAAGAIVGHPTHELLDEPLRTSVVAAAEAPRRETPERSALPPDSQVGGVFTQKALAPLPDEGARAVPAAAEPASAQAVAAPENESGSDPAATPLQVHPAYLARAAEAVDALEQSDPADQAPVATPAVAVASGPATPASRLFAGGGRAVNLRQAPSLLAPILEVMPAGARVDILDGKVRADGMAWQQVQSPNAEIGWVAAGTVGR